MSEVPEKIYLELLREVLNCGVEFDDVRINYVVMQIDRQLLTQIRAATTPHDPVEESK